MTTTMIKESTTKIELGIENDEVERVKLHKCKSLNVSLDDINCNQISTTASTTAATTPIEQQPIEVNNNKKKMSNLKSTIDIVEDDEEHLVDDESDCLEHWKVSSNKCLGALKITTKEDENKSSVPVSKSLPHSIANSLDCLTNEAYEDDEDELIKNSEEVYYPPNIAPVTKNHDMAHHMTATGDKDFITKL